MAKNDFLARKMQREQEVFDAGMRIGRQQMCDYIDDAPSVDAVEVVRCKECKHWKPLGSKAGNSFADMEYICGCEFTNYSRRESDFCSYGERRTDGKG